MRAAWAGIDMNVSIDGSLGSIRSISSKDLISIAVLIATHIAVPAIVFVIVLIAA